MEQLSRSLQTERNSLKQTIKDLEDKSNINQPPPKQEQVEEAAAPTDSTNLSVLSEAVQVEQTESMSNINNEQ